MHNLPARTLRSKSAFTLVEVCISMGILTFAIIPLMGLMTNGLMQLGTNLDKNEAAAICQEVLVSAQQQSFSQLSTTSGYTNYFTAEGDLIPTTGGDPASSTESSNIVYMAAITCTTNSVTAPTPPLVTLVIHIRKAPLGHDVVSNPSIANFVGTVSCPDISGYNAGSD